MAQALMPLAAFDVMDGAARPVDDPWPAPQSPQGYRWLHLDLNAPGTRDWVAAHLPAIAAKALMAEETRPRADHMAEGSIIVLRGVNMNPGAQVDDMVSLRCWLSPDGLVTVRLRRLMAVQELQDALADPAAPAPATPAAALTMIIAGLITRIETVSLALEDQVDTLEDGSLDGGSTAANLAQLQRRIIKLRRYVGPQREALARLAQADTPWLDAPARASLREWANAAARSVEELEANRDRLAVLQNQLDAQQSAIVSRHGYILSVVAAVFLPLGFLSGLFGVNIAGMPGLTAPWAFAALCAACVAIAAALFVFFRYHKWL